MVIICWVGHAKSHFWLAKFSEHFGFLLWGTSIWNSPNAPDSISWNVCNLTSSPFSLVSYVFISLFEMGKKNVEENDLDVMHFSVLEKWIPFAWNKVTAFPWKSKQMIHWFDPLSWKHGFCTNGWNVEAPHWIFLAAFLIPSVMPNGHSNISMENFLTFPNSRALQIKILKSKMEM